MRPKVRRSIGIFAAMYLCACAVSPAGSQAKPEARVVTAAQIFEDMKEQMRKAKTSWQQEINKLPEYNRQGKGTDRFDMLDIQVEDWYATEEAKFAHSIKIPNPVPEDSGYRPGMTQQEYFEHLCKNEAGEFIYKTVENVEGIFQLRPRKNVYGTGELQHLYSMEDPYGHYTDENENIGFQMVEPLKYSFFEIPVEGRRKYGFAMRELNDPSLTFESPPDAKIARYFGLGVGGASRKTMKLEFDIKVKARYGFTWRGIKRPLDREMGIGGGELIVLDLQTNQVMAVRRGYAIWNRGWTYRVCPRYGYDGGEDKGTAFTARFVMRVLRSPRWREYFRYVEETRKLPPGTKPFSE